MFEVLSGVSFGVVRLKVAWSSSSWGCTSADTIFVSACILRMLWTVDQLTVVPCLTLTLTLTPTLTLPHTLTHIP